MCSGILLFKADSDDMPRPGVDKRGISTGKVYMGCSTVINSVVNQSVLILTHIPPPTVVLTVKFFVYIVVNACRVCVCITKDIVR